MLLLAKADQNLIHQDGKSDMRQEPYTNRPKDRARLFDSLPPEPNQGVTSKGNPMRGFRYEAGLATGMVSQYPAVIWARLS